MSLGPLGPLLGLIRTHALSLERKPRQDQRSKRDPAHSGGVEDLMDGVLTAIGRLPQELPDRRRRALRVFLQATLARELGFADANARGCQDLVERVLEEMGAQDQLRNAMDEAGDLLIARARAHER